MRLFHHDQTVTNCSHDGVTYERQQDGSFNIPAEALEALTSHGFTTAPPDGWKEPEPAPKKGKEQQKAKEPEQPQEPTGFPTLADTLKALPNKAALAAYGAEHFGLQLNERDTREDLEAAILEADATRQSSTQE